MNMKENTNRKHLFCHVRWRTCFTETRKGWILEHWAFLVHQIQDNTTIPLVSPPGQMFYFYRRLSLSDGRLSRYLTYWCSPIHIHDTMNIPLMQRCSRTVGPYWHRINLPSFSVFLLYLITTTMPKKYLRVQCVGFSGIQQCSCKVQQITTHQSF